MGRDYGRELREKGILCRPVSNKPALLAKYFYALLDAKQKRAFCSRLGLMLAPGRKFEPAMSPGLGEPWSEKRRSREPAVEEELELEEQDEAMLRASVQDLQGKHQEPPA